MTRSRGLGTSDSLCCVPFITTGLRSPPGYGRGLHPYYTQIEVTAALLVSVRVGVNAGELLDFILGWTTLDLFGDDIASVRPAEEPACLPR